MKLVPSRNRNHRVGTGSGSGSNLDLESRDSSRDDDELSQNSGGVDDFARSISRIAVVQICESAGFQSFQQSALDALSDIGIRYLRDLGKTARFYANSAGRTGCSVFDVVQGLEDLDSSWGFNGASVVNRCLVGSGVVGEIARYVESAEEIPFARPVPRFPVVRSRKPTPSFAQIGETPSGKHIPDWLPAFPDPHTYIHTPIWNERATDPRTDKIEQARQRRKAEQSLLSLQQRLACSGGAGPSSVDATVVDAVKAKGVFESNPFLAPPMQYGEKEVSPVAVPGKLSNHTVGENPISVLETFAPAIEAAKNGICNLEENLMEKEKKVLPNKRPTVHFRFGIDKKSVAVPLGLTARNSSGEKMVSWFLRDDEKDDKKRRAEQILKESMENQQDLPLV